MLRGGKAARAELYAPHNTALELRLVKGNEDNYKHGIDRLRIAILAFTSLQQHDGINGETHDQRRKGGLIDGRESTPEFALIAM